VSRLDSFIRRLQAQRACLAYAVERVRYLQGVFLELGLGNGRTYDHLRELCPEREIFCFDRHNAAHPDCVPDVDHLVLGDIRATLPVFLDHEPGRVVLIHADFGSGHRDRDARVAAEVAALLPPLLHSGGVVLSDQVLDRAGLDSLEVPADVPPDRYFMYARR
jgi:hypothetical protein